MFYIILYPFLIAWALLTVLSMRRHKRLPYHWPLLIGLIAVGLFVTPFSITSTIGGVLFFCVLIWLPDSFLRKHSPKFQRQMPPIVGVALALLVVTSAGIGLRHLHEQNLPQEERSFFNTDYWKIESRVVYEAAQAILLDMDVHAEENDSPPVVVAAAPDADTEETSQSAPPKKTKRLWSFALARFFAVVLAVFVTYQTLRQYCVDALNRLGIFWIATRVGPDTCLVVGLGHVGMQIVNDLVDDYKIIAIENDKNNPNIKEAREKGVFVMELDALRDESIEDMPWKGLKEAYIVAGSDETNLRVALNLKAKSAVQMSDGSGSLFKVCCDKVKDVCYKSLQKKEDDFTCYVRLDDPDLRHVLDQAFSAIADKEAPTFKFFNSNANAARLLVQERLALKCNRPPQNGTALYVIVGFEDMGMEVAKAIAQLAHFDNFKRSRILVLVDESKDKDFRRLEQFIIRYPRFTNPDLLPDFLRSAIPDTVREIGEAAYHHSLGDGCHWAKAVGTNLEPTSGSISKQIPKQTEQIERRLPQLQDVDFLSSKESDSWSSADGTPGIEFATHCYFASMPSCASDSRLLRFLADAARKDSDPVNPSVIVCLEQEDEAFVWSEILESAWREHCYRNHLADTLSRIHSKTKTHKINLYPWIPYGEHLRKVTTAEDSKDPKTYAEHWHRLLQIHPFGEAEKVSSVEAIRGEQREAMAKLASASHAVLEEILKPKPDSKKPSAEPLFDVTEHTTYPEDLLSKVRFADQQSNEYASDHVHIKIKLLTEDGLEVPRSTEIPSALKMDQIEDHFSLPEVAENICVPIGSDSYSGTLLDMLAQTEHNRWCAELLMRNARFGPENGKLKYAKGRKAREPHKVSWRSTLAPWADSPNLPSAEKRKDWYQVYFVLYHLKDVLKPCR